MVEVDTYYTIFVKSQVCGISPVNEKCVLGSRDTDL